MDSRSDKTVCQNSLSSSEIDENEILAAKKKLEFAFDAVDNSKARQLVNPVLLYAQGKAQRSIKRKTNQRQN